MTYDDAVEAAFKASPDPHDADIGAALDAAYPIIEAAVRERIEAILDREYEATDDEAYIKAIRLIRGAS